MNREALDEFFANAEDVLTDWSPDPYEHPDVMVARVDDEGAELPVADSYYAQIEWPAFGEFVLFERSAEQPDAGYISMDVTFDLTAWQRALDEAIRLPIDHAIFMGPPVTEYAHAEPTDETPRDRALRLRRERNTGPTDRLGLDGHLRRRGTR